MPGERACLHFRSVRGRCLVILSTSLELALIPPQDKIKLWAVWSLFQRVALKGRKSLSAARVIGCHSSCFSREERAWGE